MLDIAAICLVVTALLAYLNQRFVGLPTTIGVMAASLLLSVALIGVDLLGWLPGLRDFEASLMASIDFSEVLLQGMLSLLLFVGALHIDLSELRRYRWQITALAVDGTLLSTLVVGIAMWALLPLVDWELPLLTCLLFGALISPTDPIAVVGILKSAGAPRDWRAASRWACRWHWHRAGSICPAGSAWVLTWGGLRGGISVALALSVPASSGRELLVPLTYAVVVFSVLVQGLSIGKVVKASVCQSTAEPAGDRGQANDPGRPATAGHPGGSRPGR